MSNVTCQISVSLDGFAAGPNQSVEHPLGEGGERLHEWFFADDPDPVDEEIGAGLLDGIGAYVMGRKMFGGGAGSHDESWRGWWGEDPPYHAPVFVLTHHPREPLVMDGGTTFFFVTEGIESALAQAREEAGDLDVGIAGGASTVQQYLAAGLLDEIHLHLVPILLAAGERLFAGAGDPRLEQIEVRPSPVVTHVRDRFGPR